jgi:RND superfamily putative drug exporter
VATFLYSLGKASYLHAKSVIAAWIVALIAISIAGFGFGGQTDEEFTIPGSESQAAFDRLQAVFPTFGGASAQVVLVAPEGQRLDDAESRALIGRMTNEIKSGTAIEDAISPFDEFAGRALSDDGRYGFISVRFEVPDIQVTDAMLEELVSSRDLAEGTGIIVEYGGNVFQDQQVGLTIAEVIGVAFAGLVLIVTFRSFRPAWMPLASAIVGVGIVMGILFSLAHVVTISSSAPLLAVMLGLAVGIDYSLFILSRHRSQLAAGDDPVESAATSVGTSGNAVVFAGVTVIIALLGLFLVGIPFLSVMGAGAAIAVAIAIVAAITLLPAVMGVAGEKLRPKPSSAAAKIAALSAESPSMGRRWVRMVTKRPLLVSIITVATLGTLALPALSLDLNLPSGGQEPEESTQRKAFDLVSEGFGPGYNGPLLVAVDITGTNDVIEVLEDLRDDFETIPGVDYVSEGFPSPTLDTGIFQLVPQTAPDSPETKQLVADIRDMLPTWEDEYNTPMAVTGVTAIGVDVSSRIQSALIPFGIVVVGLSIILLIAVFRSILVPIKAALGFLLSVTAAFGVVVGIFQWGYGAELLHVTPGPILSFMPIILMAVLFGLAMDYEVFLVAGMREQYVRTGNWRLAIEEGYAQGARVVAAAALIMFFVFFAFVPEGSNILKPIALGLAVGIAFDAFVVRMTLVPALMALFGPSAWWIPRPVDIAVPHADVEGEGLREYLVARQWADSHPGLAISASYLTLEHEGYHPINCNISRGSRVDLVGTPAQAVAFAGVLAGISHPHSGSLHVLGHPLPSEATAVSQLVTVWSRSDEDVLTALGVGLDERIRWSRSGSALSATEREQQVSATINTINRVARELQLSASPLTAASLPGVLPREQQILVYAALALADQAPIVVVSPVEPVVWQEERELWWAAINALRGSEHTVLLCSAPPARAMEQSSREVVDLMASEAVES